MLSFDQTVAAEFLQSRYLALELAAVLDRLDEAAAREGRPAADQRLRFVQEAIQIIAAPSPRPDRVERILRVYSETP